MIKSNTNYSIIKQTIQELFSCQVEVTQNLGRNKFVSFCGVVTGIYPALFTVKPDIPSFNGKTSFSYSEVMCGNVKITEKQE